MTPVRFGLIDIKKVRPGAIIVDKQIPTFPERLQVLAQPVHIPAQVYSPNSGDALGESWEVLVCPAGTRLAHGNSRFNLTILENHLAGSPNPVDRFDIEA